MILLPGTSYTSVGNFVSSDSGPALSGVTNLDGSHTNLIFDVHQYLDSDFSGTHADCTITGTDNLNSLANWLRSNGRQAYVALLISWFLPYTNVTLN
jgi:endoglucanase